MAAKIRANERRIARLETLEGPIGGGDWVLIETQQIANGTSIATFTAIPQIHRHLFIIASLQANLSAPTMDALHVQFNNDTGANYATYIHSASFSTTGVNSGGGASRDVGDHAFFGSVTHSVCGESEFEEPSTHGILIPDYQAAISQRGWRGWSFAPGHGCLEVAGASVVEDFGGNWTDDTPITEIDFFLSIGTFTALSTISLYGING